jgi:hypothetical protein
MCVFFYLPVFILTSFLPFSAIAAWHQPAARLLPVGLVQGPVIFGEF